MYRYRIQTNINDYAVQKRVWFSLQFNWKTVAKTNLYSEALEIKKRYELNEKLPANQRLKQIPVPLSKYSIKNFF